MREFFLRQHFPDFFRKSPNSDYVIFEAHPFTLQSVTLIRKSAREVYRIFEKILDYLCNFDDAVLVKIGIPENLIQTVRIGYQSA